jgi:hypothetical protein
MDRWIDRYVGRLIDSEIDRLWRDRRIDRWRYKYNTLSVPRSVSGN